jgi:GET complex subunit GET2
MTESVSPSPTPEDVAAAQTRRRKERREAKIKAGGSARLNKITGLGGGIQRGEHFQVGPVVFCG